MTNKPSFCLLLLACLASVAVLSACEKLNQLKIGNKLAKKEQEEAERAPTRTKTPKELLIERGKMIFVKASCWGCHPHGENSLNGDKPLKGSAFAKKYTSDQAIIDFVRKGSPDEGMPPFPPEKLSDQDLKSVIAYIRSLDEP